jgi:hypothetical protein
MTKMPKDANKCNFMMSLLKKLNKYVNNSDIHKFTVKIDSSRNIKIYVFVDFSSEYLMNHLRAFYLEFYCFYIKLKEYIYPLNDYDYQIYLDVLDNYKNRPFIIGLMGKNAKYFYINQYIKKNYKISNRTQKSIIKMVLDNSN